ncbi:MAG: hypothetical protein ACM31D_12825 [Bacteroidota bacterium]
MTISHSRAPFATALDDTNAIAIRNTAKDAKDARALDGERFEGELVRQTKRRFALTKSGAQPKKEIAV